MANFTFEEYMQHADKIGTPEHLAIVADELEGLGYGTEAEQIRSFLETGDVGMLRLPDEYFPIGSTVLVEQQTLYFIGRIKDKGIGWVLLEDASWVHWTGRVSELHAKKDITQLEERQPRTEYVGYKFIFLTSSSSATPEMGKPWVLPTRSI